MASPQRARPRPPTTTPDPDAVMVASVLAASDQPMTVELLLSAAKAYAALKSSRERAERLALDQLAKEGTTSA